MDNFLSGFVTIIGSPNVGKSTLINRFVGQKVSIVSERAQTTRNKVMGVLSNDNYQIVFIDTPGVTSPRNKLGEYMVKTAYDSLNAVEVILLLIDAENGMRDKDKALLDKLSTAKSPVIAAINKIDSCKPEVIPMLRERLSSYSFVENVIEISAKSGEGVLELESLLVNYLVPGPQYFPPDMVTDMPERVICSEMIREKALMLLKDEVPHGIGVGIDKMHIREEKEICDMWATIYCERDSHKGIIIGKSGAMLKKIGSEARKDIEWLLGVKVNLQLWVKVRDDWRNSSNALRELGYE